MAHSSARGPLSSHLRTHSYLLLRLLTPLLMYIPLSLCYTLVSLAFGIQFGARYNPTAGFVLFFIYVYLAMCSLGLALEAMITVLSPRFAPFFLVCLVSLLAFCLLEGIFCGCVIG